MKNFLLKPIWNLLCSTPFNTANTAINNLLTILTWLGISTFAVLMFFKQYSLLIFTAVGIIISFLLLCLLWKPNGNNNTPYTPWTPVTPPHFVGREKILKRLEENLEKNESVSLVGDRHIGKTSLLETWKQKVEAQGRLVIYVSGEGAEGASISAFVHEITKKLTSDEPEEAANILSDWAEREKERTGFHPMILVDKAERIIENFHWRFFERLRGMLDRVIFVIASRHEIDLIYKKINRVETSPFDNRFRILRLKLLETKAAKELIKWGNFSPQIAKQMDEWAGRHPFYLQLFGEYFWNIKDKEIGAALDDFQTDAATKLREVWDTLNEKEQEDLKQSQGKRI